VPGSSQSRCDRLIGFGKSKHGKLPYPKILACLAQDATACIKTGDHISAGNRAPALRFALSRC
jgi:hypothetical protein